MKLLSLIRFEYIYNSPIKATLNTDKKTINF